MPMIMAGPDVPVGTCETPVDLLDISATISAHFGLDFQSEGVPLPQIAAAAPDPDRVILSQYHAVGSVSAGFMLRKGRWKLNTYVGFEPELFDLHSDPEEATNLATQPAFAEIVSDLTAELRRKVDPEAANAQAFADQAALIESYDGREAALNMGAPGATPPPAT